MNYDETVPDWDADDLPRRAALDARLQDMLIQSLDRDPRWSCTVAGLADDLVTNDEVRKMLSRFCIVYENLTLLFYDGPEHALDDMRRNLGQLRAIAMRGGTLS